MMTSQSNHMVKAALLFTGMLVGASVFAATSGVYPSHAAFFDDVPKNAEWYQQCLRLRAEEPPRRDLPSEPDVAALKQCVATDLYYDTQNLRAPTNADWQKVRACAFASKESGVLAMLYANGKGVSKDLKLAIKYACSTESASAEMAGRVENLTHRMVGKGNGDFDVCEDITSGYMQGICAVIDDRQQGKRRDARLAALVKTWPAKDQFAFQKLKKAVSNFAQHRSDDETDLSGTARATQEIEAMAAELDRFVSDIENFEKGQLPVFTGAEFIDLDRRLNIAYQSLMRVPQLDAADAGSIKKGDVRKTQRTWLVYRDAMAAFGAARFPALPAVAWKALLTQRRIKQLAQFVAAATQN